MTDLQQMSYFKFLNLVTDNNMWFEPECTGSGSDGKVGPSPRAFHIAVAIDCHMFVFGGRSGGNRYSCKKYICVSSS